MRIVVGFIFGLLASPVLAQSGQWDAVGLLTVDGGGFCTATLIDDRHILTAAHCVYDTDTGAFLDQSRMAFKARWRQNQAQAVRRIKAVAAHPRFVPQQGAPIPSVQFDLAVLELRIPIRSSQIRPFQIAPLPVSGTKIGVVPALQSRLNRQTRAQNCDVLGDKNRALVLDCPVDFGTSGAPVFRFDLGVAMIVSVISSKAELNNTPVSLAVRVHDQHLELFNGLDVKDVVLGLR